jgi:hypothetical protein
MGLIMIIILIILINLINQIIINFGAIKNFCGGIILTQSYGTVGYSRNQ